MSELLFSRYFSAIRFLHQYSDLYNYTIDVYEVDESSIPPLIEDHSLYLDFIVTKFVSLPKKTIPVRFIDRRVEVEGRELGSIVTSGFSIGILDSVLREHKVTLKVGDVVATSNVFEELAQIKSFELFTKPAFVRVVQSIVPNIVLLTLNTVVEWRVELSSTDVVFRYYV